MTSARSREPGSTSRGCRDRSATRSRPAEPDTAAGVALPQPPAPPTATRTRRRRRRPEHRRRSRSTSARPARAGSSRSACCWSGRSCAHNSTAVGRRHRPARLCDPPADRAAAHRLAHRRRRRRRRAASRCWLATLATVALIVLLVVFRRWRHLFTLLGSIARAAGRSAQTLYTDFTRPRPYDVTIIGDWAGFSLPSAPGRGRSPSSLVGIAYSMVVPGRPRTIAKWVGCGRRCRRICRGRLYLARRPSVRHRVGIALAVAHRRQRASASSRRTRCSRSPTGGGKTAHLDVGGRARRGDPRARSQDQLGLTRARHQAGRPRRLGRLDAAAAPRRGRPRHVPVREALRDEPRARRPLVQARPHDPLRPARGRGAVPVGAAPRRSTRTTRCGSCATSASRPPRRTASSS